MIDRDQLRKIKIAVIIIFFVLVSILVLAWVTYSISFGEISSDKIKTAQILSGIYAGIASLLLAIILGLVIFMKKNKMKLTDGLNAIIVGLLVISLIAVSILGWWNLSGFSANNVNTTNTRQIAASAAGVTAVILAIIVFNYALLGLKNSYRDEQYRFSKKPSYVPGQRIQEAVPSNTQSISGPTPQASSFPA